MPVKYFDCSAGKVDIAACLAGCPLPERCLSIPTLHELAKNRTFEPPYVFSTTQLINPTRLAYLQIVKPYSINPLKSGFKLLGTRHHGMLEAVAKKIEGMVSEVQLGGDISGILDLLQPNNGDDTYTMIDYKTIGCFAIKKLLDGDWSSGYDLQLNHYRIKAKPLGFDVTKLFLQYTARDGNTRTFKEYGIPAEMGLIPVPMLPDDTVVIYFYKKDTALRSALETNTLPPMCGYEERWGNHRCIGFCDVKEFCPEGSKMR